MSFSEWQLSPLSTMEDDINDAALKEALESGIDLRQYSTEVEQKLRQVRPVFHGVDHICWNFTTMSVHQQSTCWLPDPSSHQLRPLLSVAHLLTAAELPEPREYCCLVQAARHLTIKWCWGGRTSLIWINQQWMHECFCTMLLTSNQQVVKNVVGVTTFYFFQVENASIQDYIKESRNITELHSQITACDQILEASIYTTSYTHFVLLKYWGYLP